MTEISLSEFAYYQRPVVDEYYAAKVNRVDHEVEVENFLARFVPIQHQYYILRQNDAHQKRKLVLDSVVYE